MWRAFAKLLELARERPPMMRCINCGIGNAAVSINVDKGTTIVSEVVRREAATEMQASHGREMVGVRSGCSPSGDGAPHENEIGMVPQAARQRSRRQVIG